MWSLTQALLLGRHPWLFLPWPGGCETFPGQCRAQCLRKFLVTLWGLGRMLLGGMRDAGSWSLYAPLMFHMRGHGPELSPSISRMHMHETRSPTMTVEMRAPEGSGLLI